MQIDLADVTLETFVPLVGSTFELSAFDAEGAEHLLALELREAEAWPAPPGDRGRAPFTLLFVGPADKHVGQGTHPLSHRELGKLEIFIVPVARDADGTRYQAVFT